ncbi:MAG: NuoM family protein [Myxococcaceae bacterium]
MSFFDSQILHLTIFLPILFGVLVAFLPSQEKGQIRTVTFIAMLVDALVGLAAYLQYDPKGPEFQLENRLNWMPDFGISFHTGVDGLAVSLILLTVFLGPLVVLASWTFINERVKEFHLALLFLQTAMIGALASLDIIVFYLFFEAMLIPMYLLIGVWGSEERQMAAVKFFLYTLVGSLLMLIAILGVYFIAQPAGARSFDYATVFNSLLGAQKELSACMNTGGCDTAHLSPLAMALKVYGPWMFLAFAVAFAVKVPLFPVHTWLPDAHVQAPVAGSMILAGVMLKMGTFGFWRFAVPLFPVHAREFRVAIAILGVIGIVYGALMCLAQRDVKKLIAYSSVSHLGYCMLGMFAFTAEGATGSAYQMLNHGVSTGALFLLFGMLYERRHTRLIADYGGIARVMPLFAAFFVIVTFSSIAVPGTNGFIGEFLVLLGTFKSSLKIGIGVFAATGVILGAAYMLWLVQRVFFGEVTLRENQRLFDLNFREVATTVPFLILILVMGLRPQMFLDYLNPASDRFVARALYGSNEANVTLDQVQMKVMPLAQVATAEQEEGQPPPRLQMGAQLPVLKKPAIVQPFHAEPFPAAAALKAQ